MLDFDSFLAGHTVEAVLAPGLVIAGQDPGLTLGQGLGTEDRVQDRTPGQEVGT